MRKTLLYICIIAFSNVLNGQNLVTNGSFEDKKYCPVTFNMERLNQIKQWTQVGKGTPDYFHECSKDAGVPKNLFGSLPAQDGKGYAGLVTYSASSRDYREYLSTKLTRPLSAGELICVEYYVSTADLSNFVTDGLGFYFSKSKLSGNRDKVIKGKVPQVKNLNLNLLDGYGEWIKISDVFTAEGGEQYLTIGNFKPDRMTTILMRNGEGNSLNKWSYIYLDQISVTPIEKREDCSCINDIIKNAIYDPPLELKEYREIDIKSILFDFDEAKITAEAKKELDLVLELLYANDAMYLNIIGHTDVVGSGEYNLGLSENRAKSVIDYFILKGINLKRLQLDYKGSEAPVATNDTSDGRKQNRRVEFEILEYKYTRVIGK